MNKKKELQKRKTLSIRMNKIREITANSLLTISLDPPVLIVTDTKGGTQTTFELEGDFASEEAVGRGFARCFEEKDVDMHLMVGLTAIQSVIQYDPAMREEFAKALRAKKAIDDRIELERRAGIETGNPALAEGVL